MNDNTGLIVLGAALVAAAVIIARRPAAAEPGKSNLELILGGALGGLKWAGDTWGWGREDDDEAPAGSGAAAGGGLFPGLEGSWNPLG